MDRDDDRLISVKDYIGKFKYIWIKEYKTATRVYMLWYKHDGSCRARGKVEEEHKA
jgi:hypothetical protein